MVCPEVLDGHKKNKIADAGKTASYQATIWSLKCQSVSRIRSFGSDSNTVDRHGLLLPPQFQFTHQILSKAVQTGQVFGKIL
jgi:hypothetical protein